MIQIGFSTSNLFLSKVIRWITKSKVSHCWFLIDLYGHQIVLQADIGGVKFSRLKDNHWVLVNKITPKQDINLGPAMDVLNEHYDYLGLFGNIWVYIGRWLKQKWKNPLVSPHSLFCSELITKVLKAQNYPGTDKLDPGSTSPEDLLEFFQK